MAQVATWRNCYKCGFEGKTPLSQCPHCGQRLRSANEIRGLGVVLFLIGGLLSSIGGGLFVLVALLVAQAGQPGSNVKMTEEARGGVIFLFIFGIFALLVALGLTAMLAGVWQILFGRRNKFFVYVFLGLVVVTLIAGSITTSLIE